MSRNVFSHLVPCFHSTVSDVLLLTSQKVLKHEIYIPSNRIFFKRNRVLKLPFWLCGRHPAFYEVTCDASIGALVGHSQMVVTFQ
jgi:hypothetical protein